jgi:transaldolase
VTRLHQLFAEHGQSPWLDDIKRSYLRSGELGRLIESGIRGVTANPTIFERGWAGTGSGLHAIAGSDGYSDEFRLLTKRHVAVEDAYWDLVIDDVVDALHVLRPLYDQARGGDGFASLELPPSLANSTGGSVITARSLHQQISEPNLLVKIPATRAGIRALYLMIAEGRSINLTSIFSLDRYEQAIDAYLSGLEAHPGDLAAIHSVASFSLSRVDTEVDRRLDEVGTDEALALRGRAGIAQAKLAYHIFRDKFSGPRWEPLVNRGARIQRPLWASTSTDNPAYPDTLYVDNLIGPNTINTLPEQTITAFENHGRTARTVDQGIDEAAQVFEHLRRVAIDLSDVGRILEAQAVAALQRSYVSALATLSAKTSQRIER